MCHERIGRFLDTWLRPVIGGCGRAVVFPLAVTAHLWETRRRGLFRVHSGLQPGSHSLLAKGRCFHSVLSALWRVDTRVGSCRGVKEEVRTSGSILSIYEPVVNHCTADREQYSALRGRLKCTGGGKRSAVKLMTNKYAQGLLSPVIGGSPQQGSVLWKGDWS